MEGNLLQFCISSCAGAYPECTLPFGPLHRQKSAAEIALLHAGIHLIDPTWERNAMIAKARWIDIEQIAEMAEKDALEVERAIARVARTLVTWERNACRWSTRYVAVEPASQFTDGSSERDQRREHGNRNGSV